MEKQDYGNYDPWAEMRVKDINQLPLGEVYSIYEGLALLTKWFFHLWY